MKHFSVLMSILLALGLLLGGAGCTDKAKELFETAKLEELQNNPEHAAKLYQEILKDHPKSPYAEQAKARLEAIGKP